MKSALVAVLFFVCVPFTFAGDFHSEAFTAPLSAINVPDHHFLRIRNFTQDAAGARGTVSVTVGSGAPTIVLSAAVATSGVNETINSVVIAGPATVTVTAGSGHSFITYIKQHDSD